MIYNNLCKYRINRYKIRIELKEMSKIDELLKNIEEINSKLTRIESLLLNKGNTINIETLTMNEPTLNELVFNIDTVDVKENSGSLNIGTTFNPTVVNEKEKQKKKEEEKHKEEKVKENEITIFVNGEHRNYSIERGV